MPGEVPSGWERSTLGRIAEVILGQSPPSALCNNAGVGLPFFQGNAEFGPLHPIPKQWIVEEFKIAEPTDVLLSVRAPVGELNITLERCVIGRGLAAIRGKSADPRFIYYLLHERRRLLDSLGQGSTFEAINGTDLRSLPLLLPPIPEQKKIAAILSSVDEAIQATQRVIDQTRRVKEGLLHGLLTHGLPGHTRFKHTALGELPDTWEAVLLDSVAQRGSGHTPDKKHPEYWGGDIWWVSLADSHRLDAVYLSETTSKITALGIENSSAVLHPVGTVFVSRDASVGRSAIAAVPLAVSQHFIAWRCGPRLINQFLYYFLQHHKRRFEQIAAGSTIKTIGLGYFKAFRIPLPPLREQQDIATRLFALDQVMWCQEAHSEHLKQVKTGLFQDLLTGKVRVSP